MPLDTASLTSAIKAAFKKAKDTPPPVDPSQADQAQEQILTQLAQDLTGALTAFVQTADVTQVTVQVTSNGVAIANGVVIGAGTQTKPGKLQ
jgi:hypothetical protein